MERSLLDLLESERRQLQEIKLCKESIEKFDEMSLESLGSEYKIRLKESENNLTAIRAEIMKYFLCLFNK